MRRRASPLHDLLVPAPPPGALKGVAAGAAIYNGLTTLLSGLYRELRPPCAPPGPRQRMGQTGVSGTCPKPKAPPTPPEVPSRRRSPARIGPAHDFSRRS